MSDTENMRPRFYDDGTITWWEGKQERTTKHVPEEVRARWPKDWRDSYDLHCRRRAQLHPDEDWSERPKREPKPEGKPDPSTKGGAQ